MPITTIHPDGTPFRGKRIDPDAKAKLTVIRRALEGLKDSAFFDSAQILDSPETPDAQVILDFPSVITFSGAKKNFLPAILNAADAYTVIRTDAGFRVTATVLGYWKED